MLRWIVGSSLKFRLLVLPLAAALMVLGITQVRNAPVDALPEFTLPVVQVQTESLGLSAAEVEQLITVPMEQDLLNGVRGVRDIRSSSVPGLSSITMVFERGTSILEARQLVQERLTQAHALPQVSKPPQMIQPTSSTGRVMMIGLSSKKLTPIQLSVLARWTVKPRLMGLAGVANVAIWGNRDRQLQVKVDPRRLREKGVDLTDVITTTGNSQLVSQLSFVEASTPGTGGFIDGKNQRLGVRHILPFGKPDDLGQVPLEGNHPGLRLGDVATVVEDHQPLIGDAVVNGGNGLMLVVEKSPGANTLEVTRRIDNALDELRPGMSDVTVDARVFRPASFIDSAMSHLKLIALIAAGLIAAALVAFFQRWRPVFVALVTIPLSLVTAVLVLVLTGATINALVIAGLVVALGLVIDDAICDTESISRRLREGREADRSTASVIFGASLQMRRPLGYASLIVLLAMLPVFFAEGLSGAFVHPMAAAYVLAVVASMLVALAVTPALSLLVWSRPPRPHSESALARRISHGYEGRLASGIRTPRPALLGFGLVVLAGLAVLPFLGQSLRPTFKDRQLMVRWSGAPGISLPEMDRITKRASNELRSLPGVQGVGAHVGRAVTSDQVANTSTGELWVTLKSKADYDAAVASVRRVASGTPGFRGEVATYESDRSEGVLTRTDHPLVVRVYGQDMTTLHRQAEQVQGTLARVKGLGDSRIQAPQQQPTLVVEADVAAARKYDLKPGDIRRAAATLIAGLEVGQFFEQQKVFEVVVRGVGSTHDSLTSVRALLIDTPSGGTVRMDKVASVSIQPNPVDIRHEDVERYMDVRAAVQGRSLADVQSEVRRRIQELSFPLEYHAQVVQPDGDVAPTNHRFVSLAIAALIGIYLLLQAAFGSWRLATLLFFALPMALSGGLLTAFAAKGDLSLGAAAGLFTILGIAVRNGVVLISRYRELERDEGGEPRSELVVRATRERLVPVLMTAVTTGLAVAPFIALGDVAGNEITHSMAAVVAGGLVTSTLLTLFVLPSMYLHFGSRVPAGVRRRAPSVSSLNPQSDTRA